MRLLHARHDAQATEAANVVRMDELRVLDAMLEEDRTAICGPRYAHEPDRVKIIDNSMDIDTVVAVNLKGTFNLTHFASGSYQGESS